MHMFVEKGVMNLFLDMLEFGDSSLIVKILKGLEELFFFLREHRIWALEDKNLQKHLEMLQYNPDQTVLEMSQKIIDKFFYVD